MLSHRLPRGTVRRLLLLGERIEGTEALTAGIATHLADEAQVIATADQIARQAVAVSRATIETKRFLGALERGAVDLAAWQTVRMELLASPERFAAIAAAKSRLHS